jgi:hypothetical protein
MSTKKRPTKKRGGVPKRRHGVREIEDTVIAETQYGSDSDEEEVVYSFNTCVSGLVHELDLSQEKISNVKETANLFLENNPDKVQDTREILNKIVDEDVPFEDLDDKLIDQIAALRYAAYYFRGKYKSMYQEAKQIKAALEHSEKRSAEHEEKNLVNDVVGLYMKKGGFPKKASILRHLFMFCPIPFQMRRFRNTEELLFHKIDHKNGFFKYIFDALIIQYDMVKKPSPPILTKLGSDPFRRDIFNSLSLQVLMEYRNVISHEKKDIFDACQEALMWLETLEQGLAKIGVSTLI